MNDPTDRASAFRALQNFRRSLPGLIDEECVDEYHGIIESLEKPGNLNLQGFKIDVLKLSFKIVAAQTAQRYPPGRIQYSNKRYCDSDYFYEKLGRLLAFLDPTIKM
jgi:hypothetical protein